MATLPVWQSLVLGLLCVLSGTSLRTHAAPYGTGALEEGSLSVIVDTTVEPDPFPRLPSEADDEDLSHLDKDAWQPSDPNELDNDGSQALENSEEEYEDLSHLDKDGPDQISTTAFPPTTQPDKDGAVAMAAILADIEQHKPAPTEPAVYAQLPTEPPVDPDTFQVYLPATEEPVEEPTEEVYAQIDPEFLIKPELPHESTEQPITEFLEAPTEEPTEPVTEAPTESAAISFVEPVCYYHNF